MKSHPDKDFFSNSAPMCCVVPQSTSKTTFIIIFILKSVRKLLSKMEVVRDIDYILSNYVGGIGLWQWMIMLALWPINFASTNALILHMFTAFAPRHR